MIITRSGEHDLLPCEQDLLCGDQKEGLMKITEKSGIHHIIW